MTAIVRNTALQAVLTLLLFSCSADAGQETAVREPVRFTAGSLTVTEQTRAASTDDLQSATFAEGEEIAVYVVDRDNASTYAATPYLFRTGAAAGGENALTYAGGTLLYPANTASNIDVYAYYPYDLFKTEGNRSNVEFAVSVAADQSDVADYRASDVMRAEPVLNHSRYPKATSTIHLQFSHLMAQVTIRLKQGEHKGTPAVNLIEAELTGSSVTLADVATTAMLNLADGTVSTGSAAGDITICRESDLKFYDGEAATPMEYAIVLPPQDVSGKVLTIRTGYGRTIAGTLPTMAALAGGNRHVLSVTVNDTYLTVTPLISISDWTKYTWTTDE